MMGVWQSTCQYKSFFLITLNNISEKLLSIEKAVVSYSRRNTRIRLTRSHQSYTINKFEKLIDTKPWIRVYNTVKINSPYPSLLFFTHRIFDKNRLTWFYYLGSQWFEFFISLKVLLTYTHTFLFVCKYEEYYIYNIDNQYPENKILKSRTPTARWNYCYYFNL